MSNLKSRIAQVLQTEVTSRHSYFQLKYFVIGKEPTLQAKMWQCLREIKSRNDSIASMELEIEDTKDNIELLSIELDKHEEETKNLVDCRKKENEIKKRKLNRKKTVLFNSLRELHEKKKWLEEETTFFLNTYDSLSKIEELKPFDDLDSQMEYWNQKLTEKVNLKFLTQQPSDPELVMTVLSLPDGVPIKTEMVKKLESVQKKLMEMKKQEE